MSHKKMNLKLDTTKYTKDVIKRTQDIFAKQFQNEYVLEFSTTQSLYSKPDKLELKGNSTVNNDKLFKDFSDNSYTHKKELLGKVFLIQDKIKKKPWHILNETKKIGNYQCRKAVYIDDTNGEQKTITAWYAPQIPISNGPSLHHGLPGLIMQVEDDTFTILCIKVELNTKVNIKEPKGGKKVSQNEFNKIFNKKKKEGLNRAKSLLEGIESSKN
jgi:GLPGLI family protein